MSPCEKKDARLEAVQNQTGCYFRPGVVSAIGSAVVDEAALRFYHLGTKMEDPTQRGSVSAYLSGQEAGPDIGGLEDVQILEQLLSIRHREGGLTSQQKKRLRGTLRYIFDVAAETRGTEVGEEIGRYLSKNLATSKKVLGFSIEVEASRRALNRRGIDTRPCGGD